MISPTACGALFSARTRSPCRTSWDPRGTSPQGHPRPARSLSGRPQSFQLLGRNIYLFIYFNHYLCNSVVHVFCRDVFGDLLFPAFLSFLISFFLPSFLLLVFLSFCIGFFMSFLLWFLYVVLAFFRSLPSLLCSRRFLPVVCFILTPCALPSVAWIPGFHSLPCCQWLPCPGKDLP